MEGSEEGFACHAKNAKCRRNLNTHPTHFTKVRIKPSPDQHNVANAQDRLQCGRIVIVIRLRKGQSLKPNTQTHKGRKLCSRVCCWDVSPPFWGNIPSTCVTAEFAPRGRFVREQKPEHYTTQEKWSGYNPNLVRTQAVPQHSAYSHSEHSHKYDSYSICARFLEALIGIYGSDGYLRL